MSFVDLILLRILFLVLLASASAYLRPFQLTPLFAALVGTGIGLVMIFLERRTLSVSPPRAFGASIGGFVGIGTNSPAATLDINGTLAVAGTTILESALTVNDSPLSPRRC